MKRISYIFVLVLVLGSGGVMRAEAAVGSTRVCKWKDDRTGVFLLMFDDVLPSHPEVVAPALAERNMRGTFYTNPKNWGAPTSAYMKMWKDYEANAIAANHTWDHQLPSGPVPTAKAGTDYTATSGVLTWGPGVSGPKTFTVTIIGDTEPENDELISLVLSNATGGAVLGALPTAKISIIDDDAPGGFIHFRDANYSVNEGASGTTNTATIWVSRTGGSEGAVSVNYNTDFSGWTPHYRGTANGWPTADDYIVTSGTLNWAPGETADKFFNVTIRGDDIGEADETVTLMLSNPQGGARLKTAPFLDTPSAATLTILNDDPVPNGVFEFSSPTYSVTEGDSGTKNVTITVNRVGGALEMAKVKVETIAGGTATPGSDYVEKSQELQWQAGDMSPKTFTIAVVGDTIGETAETVFIKMSLVWPHKGFVSRNDTAILTINDNDSAPNGILEFSQATYSVTEGNSGTKNVTITVNRVGGSEGEVTVQYATGIGDTPVIEQLLDIIQREQIQPAQDAIFNSGLIPGSNPRLISFGMPGTNPAYYWPQLFYNYRSDYDRLMLPNNLVNRPPFGASRAASSSTAWVNTVAKALAIADIAIADEKMEYLIFHGLKTGESFWFGDWNGTTNPMFNEILDGLKTHMDNGQLWVTDHVSWHQYEQQRLGAVITTLENSPARIRLKVTDTVDDVLYNHPLTLKTQVPANWSTVRVAQGGVTNVRQVVAGEVMYDVASNGTEITLTNDDVSAPPSGVTVWTGTAGNNDWNTAGNWDNGVPVNAADASATLALSGANVTMSAAGVSRLLTVSGTGTAPVLNITQDLTATDHVRVGSDVGNGTGYRGTINHTAGTLDITVTAGRDLNIATAITTGNASAGNTGTYNFGGLSTSAPILKTRDVTIGRRSGETGYVNLSGYGTLDLSGMLRIGNGGGAGEIEVKGGNLDINVASNFRFRPSANVYATLRAEIDETGFSTINVGGYMEFVEANNADRGVFELALGDNYVHTLDTVYTIIDAAQGFRWGTTTLGGVFGNVANDDILTVGGNEFRANYVTDGPGTQFTITAIGVPPPPDGFPVEGRVDSGKFILSWEDRGEASWTVWSSSNLLSGFVIEATGQRSPYTHLIGAEASRFFRFSIEE
jgi:hypothetical protein